MKNVEHAEIKLELGGMLFTWDDEKEKINIRKHKIDFTAAADVFLDKDVFIEQNSVDVFTGEERLDAIGGFSPATVIFVVYVERLTIDGNDVIRIISARRAEKEERRRYVDGY